VKEISGIDATDAKIDVGAIVDEPHPQWVVLLVFEVSEPGYSGAFAGNVVFCFLPKLSHEVMVSKNFLAALRDSDFAQLAVEVSQNTIHGRLTYMKSPDGVSRSVGVELEVRLKHLKRYVGVISGETKGLRIGVDSGLIMRKSLAELKNPGTLEFNYQLPRIEDLVVIVGVHTQLTPRRIVEALGLELLAVFESEWELVDAKIRLVLDMPRHKDVIDEAQITIKPIKEAVSEHAIHDIKFSEH